MLSHLGSFLLVSVICCESGFFTEVNEVLLLEMQRLERSLKRASQLYCFFVLKDIWCSPLPPLRTFRILKSPSELLIKSVMVIRTNIFILGQVHGKEEEEFCVSGVVFICIRILTEHVLYIFSYF